MAGEIEEPFRLNFQADLLHSGSISFGRFESESLCWERRSIFSHNRYLEEVEKCSKPGSVTEKKAYFEAEFKRKALLKQQSLECQDGGEVPTVENNDLRDVEEDCNFNESACSSNPSKYNTETEVQHSICNSEYDEDALSQHCETQSYELYPAASQDEVCETQQSENENVAENTEQNNELTLVDHIVPVDASSEANDDSSISCQIPEKDHDSVLSAPQATFSPKVKPAAEKKLIRSPTLKTRANVDRFQKQVLSAAFKGSMKPRTIESKGSIVKKTEKNSPRPASPFIGSGAKSMKAEGLRSEKTVKAKAQFPLPEKSVRSKQSVNPSKTHLLQSANGFGFKTGQRADNRKQFDTKVAEKMQAKEVAINQVEAKRLEKQAAEMKQFRKSLNFKAKPLPSFYNQSAHASYQNQGTKISKTPNQPRPSSQAMTTRHERNPFRSSVPLNIRPSSSASSANRIHFPDSIGRYHVPEKKGNNKGKVPEARGGNMVKKHAKGIQNQTWNAPKVGVVS